MLNTRPIEPSKRDKSKQQWARWTTDKKVQVSSLNAMRGIAYGKIFRKSMGKLNETESASRGEDV